MGHKTLYNKLSLKKKSPDVSAPEGHKRRDGLWEFDVADLKAWKRG